MINNTVTISGNIQSDFSLDHSFYCERFYKFYVSVYRTSGRADIIPVIVSERLIDVGKAMIGRAVMVTGAFRSYNMPTPDKVRVMLFVFADEITLLEKADYTNDVFLQGTLCKEPIYRETPQGRLITDVMLAVNRSYTKSDYIPCIGWGRNAFYLSGLHTGNQIRTSGRIQSREYMKNGRLMTAYEMSMRLVETVD